MMDAVIFFSVCGHELIIGVKYRSHENNKLHAGFLSSLFLFFFCFDSFFVFVRTSVLVATATPNPTGGEINRELLFLA